MRVFDLIKDFSKKKIKSRQRKRNFREQVFYSPHCFLQKRISPKANETENQCYNSSSRKLDKKFEKVNQVIEKQ